MLTNDSAQPTNERYQRVFQLFQELNAELDAIGQEVQRVRGKIQGAIDKQKMYKILQELNEKPH